MKDKRCIKKKEGNPIANDPFINEQIREPEVRVVSETGEQLGIMSSQEAQKLADEADLDLVNISPKAKPPVVKIMDYGKFKFEQGKKQKEARKNQKTVELKEMRLSATIDVHDMEVKAKNVRKFLNAGDKVKISIRFRGRQMAHTDQGRTVMNAFLEMLDDVAVVEKNAKMEGRSMFMILTPKS
ncbi:MAG: translation initiation factor IF-3 [Christensenellaceae bacterium]